MKAVKGCVERIERCCGSRCCVTKSGALLGIAPRQSDVQTGWFHWCCEIWVFPKIGGTPKWMVYRENPIKMDDLGVPLFLEHP